MSDADAEEESRKRAEEESRKRIIRAIRDHMADEPSWVIIPTLIEVLARLVIRECPDATEMVIRQFLEFCDAERKRVIEKTPAQNPE